MELQVNEMHAKDEGKFKKTKIGVIPEEWELKKISEIAGVNNDSLNVNTPNDYKFYYYDLSSVDKGKIFHPSEKITFEKAPSRAKRLFKKNDVLMSTVRPNLQGFAYVDFDADDCVCSTGFAVIRGKQKSDSLFIYHNLFSNHVTNQINKLLAGSNYPAINSKDVENLMIPFPRNIDEREKISSMLSTWDKAIELKSKLIEQKKEQKKGLMQKLLTGEVRLQGFTEEWTKVKLGDVIEESNERTTKNNQYPVLTSSRQGLFLQKDYFSKQVASEDNTGYKIVRKGEFTYRTMSDDGIFVFNRLDDYEVGIVSPAYVVFRTKAINSTFLKEFINSNMFRRYMLKHLQGGTRVAYRYKDLHNTIVKLPSIKEQEAIEKIVIVFDRSIQLLEKELLVLKQQKKGLMQLLLTGKVRVKV